MAISFSGVVYANLCVGFEMYHDIYTGTVQIGILNTGTSDEGRQNDLVWDGNNFVRTHKNVASTTSTNIGDVKCVCNDVDYYDEIFFNITDAYPWYVAYENFTISNCGTIPVFVTDVELTSGSDPSNIQGHVMIWGYITGPNGVETGPWTLAELEQALYNVQLDPCNTMEVSIWILFLQDVPLNSKATYEIEITACNWNEATTFSLPGVD